MAQTYIPSAMRRWIDARLADLGLIDAPGATVPQTPLVDADGKLDSTVIRGIDLNGYNFGAVNLSYCNFTGANLANTNLGGAVCLGTNFNGADLTGATL